MRTRVHTKFFFTYSFAPSMSGQSASKTTAVKPRSATSLRVMAARVR